MLALLAEIARGELETLRARVLSGLAEARHQGKKLGRPTGSTLSPAALVQKHPDIVRLLNTDHSARNTAKITGRGPSTVKRVKTAMLAATSG